jgi:membrane-associated phospholipid phosphatase
MGGGAPMATTFIQRTETHKPISSDFRTPDLLAKWPLIGLLIVILGSLVFGILAYDVHNHGSIVQWELQIENHMHTTALNSPSWMKAIMIAGFYVGLHGYVGIVVLLGLYFLYKRFWKEFLMVAIGCGGQGALWLFLAKIFQRVRPEFDTSIGSIVNYPSFPSGHTMSGVIGFGLLAYLLVPRMTSRLSKAVIIFLALAMIVYIGFSRFFVGAHYPTDIVAGLAIGFAWTGLVFTTIELLFHKGETKYVKE